MAAEEMTVRKVGRRRAAAGLLGVGLVLVSQAALSAEPSAEGPTTSVSPLIVIAPTPLSGPGVDPDKLPASTESLDAADLQRRGSFSITDVLEQRTAGLSLSDDQGNSFARSVDYHGFTASPLQGAPQGLAVYIGAVRLNEAFGDTVNWDLIPETAVRRIDLVASDPAFGLNALGGALNLTMKTGAEAPGGSLSLEGGSFGHSFGSVEYGASRGPWSAYFAIDGGREDGWRDHSASSLARAYGDLGWSAGKSELHIVAAGGGTELGAVGPTPIDLLDKDRRTVFTFPQSTRDRNGLIALNGSYKASSAWSLQGSLYGRAFGQDHVDGNSGNFEGCSPTLGDPLFGTLCVQDDEFPAALRPSRAAFQVLGENGAPIGCPPLVAGQTTPCNAIPYGTIDRTRTRTETLGGSLQATRTAPFFEHSNIFAVGLALDQSHVRFDSNSTLGLIFPDLSIRTTAAEAPGAGQIIHSASAIAFSPVGIRATIKDLGIYATDTLDLTDRLFLTLSGRYNDIAQSVSDQTGVSPDLNGAHQFRRFNPAAGLAWKLSDAFTAYGGYAETNRAPTPLELSCSNPVKPCLLEDALVSDPALKQVVSRTWQGGVRGAVQALGARLDWRLGAYRSDNDDDIIALASALQGRGSFANVPRTRRQGLDAEVNFRSDRWMAFASASEVEATYQFSGLLASPNSPFADDNGNVPVRPGEHIGGIPARRYKAGADFNITPSLTVGGDVLGVSSQRRVGDASNQDALIAAYWVADAHVTWELGHGLQLFGRVDNLFDRKYATFGTYFETDALAKLNPSPLPDNPSPNTDTPAPPRAFVIGLRARW